LSQPRLQPLVCGSQRSLSDQGRSNTSPGASSDNSTPSCCSTPRLTPSFTRQQMTPQNADLSPSPRSLPRFHSQAPAWLLRPAAARAEGVRVPRPVSRRPTTPLSSFRLTPLYPPPPTPRRAISEPPRRPGSSQSPHRTVSSRDGERDPQGRGLAQPQVSGQLARELDDERGTSSDTLEVHLSQLRGIHLGDEISGEMSGGAHVVHVHPPSPRPLPWLPRDPSHITEVSESQFSELSESPESPLVSERAADMSSRRGPFGLW